MRRKEPECQPCTSSVVLTASAARPPPRPSAINPPDVIDRGAEVMGPMSKSAVQAVFGAVAF